ncbi:translation initiation factor IF-2 [Drosophila elegans]|uniref:translation initiation factor IF-2 n=1 Tax=Drosophila elegans TaxID=30023 RepID=UPI0007E65DA1|nr:translation initiation factor IF-2 [Drosophila elegans]
MARYQYQSVLAILFLGQLASGQFPVPRQQRSLFGPGPPPGWSSGGLSHGGWSPAPSFEFSHLPPPSSPHVTKDELLALLAAWKDVAQVKPTTQAPEPEPEPEPETTPAPPPPEDEDEPEPEPEPEAPEVPPAGPPPGVPVTVSLPALVPIQLAAMWQQPQPGAAAGGLGPLNLGGLGLGGGIALNNLGGGAAASGAAAAAGGGGAAAAAGSGVARPRARARIGGGGGGRASNAQPAIRFPVANPRSFTSNNYVAPRPRYYRDTETMRINVMAPPPYQMANVQGPVQLVPAYWQ